MDDTCIIYAPADPDDDVLDEQTGRLHDVPANPTVLYEGKCKTTPQGGLGSSQPREVNEGGDTDTRRFYAGSIPADSVEIPEGSIYVVTSSRRDPLLVNERFRVREIALTTFLVSRRLTLEHR